MYQSIKPVPARSSSANSPNDVINLDIVVHQGHHPRVHNQASLGSSALTKRWSQEESVQSGETIHSISDPLTSQLARGLSVCDQARTTFVMHGRSLTPQLEEEEEKLLKVTTLNVKTLKQTLRLLVAKILFAFRKPCYLIFPFASLARFIRILMVLVKPVMIMIPFPKHRSHMVMEGWQLYCVKI